MAANILEADTLRKDFGGLVAVNDVDFTIPERSIVSLIGPNGAGKTTFFNILTGSTSRPRATVDVPRPASARAAAAPASRQLGMARTFQNIRLFHNMSARRERAGGHAQPPQGRRLGARSARTPRPAARGGRAAAKRAASCCRYVGLGRASTTIRANLPYGDQRRLEVARALATEPTLLLLDEPTAGMNPQETADFTAFVRAAARRARADRAADRARHEGRDGRLRAGHGARLRREDRRGRCPPRCRGTRA